MGKELSDAEKRQQLAKLMSEFRTAMLVTRTDDGHMRARPLSIAGSGEGGALYFSTAVESPKVHELDVDPHVNVVMQDGRRFVSLSGVASVVSDRALIDQLWSESWKVWFPRGKDDPSLRIVAVDPVEAAYWDMSGTAGIKYVFEIAKAYVTGKRPDADDDQRHTARFKL
jgi:general stress protein 26